MSDVWNTHAQHLDKTVVMATDALFKAVDAKPSMTEAEFQAVCAAIAQRFGSVAVSSALWALETGRLEAGEDNLPAPVAAETAVVAQVSSSASWAIGKTEGDMAAAARMMAGPLGRFVRQPARETVWASTAAAGTRYVRVPGPNACAFCLMLASRGAVYTKGTALTTTGSRAGPTQQTTFRNPSAAAGHRYTAGRRPGGLKYHDHCSCRAQESFSDADLPPIIKDLQQQWEDVTYDSQGRMVADPKKAWSEHIAKTREAKDAHDHGDWDSRIITNGVKAKQHEKVTYETLARAGHTIELSPVSTTAGERSADAFVDGRLTELKAPTGVGKETVVQTVRKGRGQSPNLVIDLHRSEMSEDEALRQIDYAMERYTDVETVTLITQDKKFVRRTRGKLRDND
ncbi:VG15 protein [Corynebacterium flavescens]|uniref:VG15 protein n=1 Tax=Corynebacterium flavescens TaxID=28028 RepID=UPI0028A2C831|nr:hypothetical protein [Corynebacterium flavescens]